MLTTIDKSLPLSFYTKYSYW